MTSVIPTPGGPIITIPDITDVGPTVTTTTTTPPSSSSSTSTPTIVTVPTVTPSASAPSVPSTSSGASFAGINWQKLLAIAILIGLLLAVSQWKLGARFAQLSIVLVIVGILLGYANANGGQALKSDLANWEAMFKGPIVGSG